MEMIQVTVTAPTAADSDALSTALFVLGPDEAAELLNGLDDTSALLIVGGGAETRIVALGWPDEATPPAK